MIYCIYKALYLRLTYSISLSRSCFYRGRFGIGPRLALLINGRLSSEYIIPKNINKPQIFTLHES